MDLAAPPARVGVRVRGAVQGVGFRPFVWRLARDCAVSGAVWNDAEGVFIEAQGADVSGFLARLKGEAPPLARIEGIEVSTLPLRHEEGFEIRESRTEGAIRGRIPADAAVCQACLAELFDPANRRFGHPFIACTDCGPRFTVTHRLPYDRPQTSMAAFPMCASCTAEYRDPAGRRFHAEPIACPDCGPRLSEEPAAIWARLARGEVLAIKGIGGYHLVCHASDAAAVSRLRTIKARDAKPFAVMALNAASAALYADVDAAARAALEAPSRPIVICPRADHPLPEGVTGGLDTLGVMLAYTPLQALLFWHAAGRPAGLDWLGAALPVALVLTSGNLGGEPLITDDREARAVLGPLVDAVIEHDREIVVRCDDPVARIVAGRPMSLRRGRGEAPDPIPLPIDGPPTIAFGAHLKAAVCVTRGREAFLAQHVGDLDDPGTIRFYRETIRRLSDLLGVTPEIAACDLHPDFVSTRCAEESNLRIVRVQHHRAHAEAVAAEAGWTGRYLALTLDGYGHGDDGGAWGGEVLLVDAAGARRVGGLAALPMPGGEAAARAPWRMAAAVLSDLGRGGEIARRFADQPQAAAVTALLARGGVARTSSCGRLFDAAAGLLGITPVQRYEAEAAQRLEAACRAPDLAAPFLIDGDRLDLSPTLHQLTALSAREGSALFHGALAAGLAELAGRLAARHGARRIALGGGCLANRILAESLLRLLSECGFEVALPRIAPPGDGGLALGQAYAALRAFIEGR